MDFKERIEATIELMEIYRPLSDLIGLQDLIKMFSCFYIGGVKNKVQIERKTREEIGQYSGAKNVWLWKESAFLPYSGSIMDRCTLMDMDVVILFVAEEHKLVFAQ